MAREMVVDFVLAGAVLVNVIMVGLLALVVIGVIPTAPSDPDRQCYFSGKVYTCGPR